MHLTLQSSALSEIAADWLIVPLWENETAAGNVAELDAKLGGIFNMGGAAVANYVSILERLR